MTAPCDPGKSEGVTDANLIVKLKCNAFSKFQELYDFELCFKEFFEGVNVREPLINVFAHKPTILYAKMHSLDDKNRLLQFSNDQKDKCVLYKSIVTVSAVQEVLDYDGVIRKYHDNKEEILDLVMPYHTIPYKAQLAKKMEVFKTNVAESYLDVKTQLMNEKKIHKQYYPDTPKLEKLIESPNKVGFLSEFVCIVMEYDTKKRRVEAGVRVFSRCRTFYYLLPIRDCIHIAPKIIEVVERFVEYLTLNMDDLKEFKEVDEELNTGFIQHLQCTIGDKGEVQLTVALAYYSNIEEFAPIADFRHPVSFKAMQTRYRSQQHEDNKTDEKMEVVPEEEPKTKKSKKPDWSSESENGKEYKFVAENFDDCHPSLRFFDFAQADSHLDVAVPFLRKFYEENKEKLRISGIYVKWRVCRRPEEWTGNIKAYHHVCGDIRITRKIDGFPFHKFPFARSFGPTTVNYENVLKQLAKLIDVKKNSDLAIACEYRLVLLFFVQKCRNIIALSEMSAQFPMAKNTKTRIIFTGQNLSMIEFAYRKFGVPPAALIIWGTLKNHAIQRLIAYGVEKIANVLKMNVSHQYSKSPGKDVIPELTKMGKLLYPYLYLKRVIAIDCNPGSGSFYVIALYEKNKEAPPHPAVVLRKLEPELESKLPPTALPALQSKKRRATEDGPGNRPPKRKNLTNDRRTARSQGGRSKGDIDPEKLGLLKQIEELKAEQEQLKKLLSRGGSERGLIRGANSFHRSSDEIDISRQTDHRTGRYSSDDSFRDVGRGARIRVRCEDDGDRYASIHDRRDSDRNDRRISDRNDRWISDRNDRRDSDRNDRRDSDQYGYGRGFSRLTAEVGRSTRGRDPYYAEDYRYAVSPKQNYHVPSPPPPPVISKR